MLVRNPIDFVIESFVLALISSVRCDPILVLNPIIVFTAPDLEVVLENKTDFSQTKVTDVVPSPSSVKFVARVFLSSWLTDCS